MTYQTKPATNGTYRIKVITKNLFIEVDKTRTRPGLRLASPSSDNKQIWNLTQVSGQKDTWTITSAYDKSGLVYAKTADTYWGYGYPYPQSGQSQSWVISEKTSENKTFSKIKLSGNDDCFDSCDPENPDVVHFYYDKRLASGGPNQCYVFEPVTPGPAPGAKALDVMFIQDLTGSQQPYIDTARKQVDQIWKNLLDTGSFAPGNLRFGLVGFRDHPPQDESFQPGASKLLMDFTSNIDSVATALAAVQATGGGDGPEAQADGMADAISASWNRSTDATKVAIMITDSPPHGIKEPGDYWPDRCPCQKSPLGLAGQMYRSGITLYVIACEPTLSNYYQGARKFYEGLALKTKGKVYNLGDDVNLLSKLILGIALQATDSNTLVVEHRAAVRSAAQASNFNVTSFAQQFHKTLLASGVQHHVLDVDDMVESNPENDEIVRIWAESEDMDEANAKIQKLKAAPSRVKEEYFDGVLPQAVLTKKLISIDQAESIVQKCLHCEA